MNQSQFNTPANVSWSIEVDWAAQNASYVQNASIVQNVGVGSAQIYFLPTMGIDVVQTGTDLETLNRLLNPTIQLINVAAAELGIQIDIWLLLNWVFVVQYWSLLYDVGQVDPTLYERDGLFPATYDPMRYSDMNNIFVNDTLFGIYRDYFESTILPILEVPNGSTYIFQDLDNSTNRLEPVDVAYFQIYSCVQTQLKRPLSLIISVIVADYTFLNPAFMLIILFGAWYHGRRSPKDGTFN